MSHENGLQRWLSADRLDLTLAKIGVLVSVLLLGLRLLSPQVLLVVIPTAAGVACVLYLGAQTSFGSNPRQSTISEFAVVPPGVVGYLPSVVFVGLAALVVTIHTAGGRTVPVYLLTGVVGTVLLVQILALDEETLAPGLVLAQILVAAVVIRLTTLFVTPGFIGVDIWTHVPVYIGGIVEAESLSAISDSKYIMAPFYHAIGAVSALVFESGRTGMYLSVGLLVPLSALFVYGTGKHFLPVRWALFATALFVFTDQAIRWGLHVIPTSLGLVFFLGVLYCLTRLFYTDDLWIVSLLLVFSLATVFTHQVSTAILLTLLGVAALVVFTTRVFGYQSGQTPVWSAAGIIGTFLVTLSVTVFSWVNTPWFGEETFLWQMLTTLEATFFGEAGFLNLAGEAGGGGSESTGLLAALVPFIEWFGFALLLLAAVVGGLAMLRMKNPGELTSTYILTATTMFVIVFGFSLFGIRAILPGRWIGFMYALFAILGAVGLFYLSQNASRRVVLVVLLVVAVGYPTTMVIAEKATIDSPAFEDEYPRFSYTESEIAAVHTISEVHPPEVNSIVDSDHPYRTLYMRVGGYTGRIAELDEAGSTSPRPVVARHYQGQGPAIFHEAGEPTRSVDSRTVASDRVCSPHRNHVYASDTVQLCTTPGVDTGASA